MNPRHILPLLLVVFTGCKESEPAPASKPAAPATAPSAAVVKPVVEQAPAVTGAFEGEIDIVAESKTKQEALPTIHAVLKNGKMRFDAPGAAAGPAMGGKAYQVIALNEGKMFTVVEARKMVIEMNIAKLGEQLGLGGAKPNEPKNEPPPKVTKTGKTDTVAGRSCEEWEIVAQRGEKQVVCVAKGGGWPQIPAAQLPSKDSWAKDVFDGEHFPLRMVLFGADGTEQFRITIKKLEQKPISDAVFAIPEGYQRMDMMQMMGSMAGMAAPGASGSARPQMKLPANIEEMLKKAKAAKAAQKPQ